MTTEALKCERCGAPLMLPAPGASEVVCAYCQTATLIARPAPLPAPAPPPAPAPVPRAPERESRAPARSSGGATALLGVVAIGGAAVFFISKSLGRAGSLDATLASASAALAAALPAELATATPAPAARDAARARSAASDGAKRRQTAKSARPEPSAAGLLPPPIVTASISGVALTSGSYDLAVVRSRLGSVRGALAGCFAGVLAEHPDSPRELDIVFRIDGDGSPGGLAPTNVTAGTELTSCVTRTLLHLKYPAPADGKKVELKYVLRFATAGAS